MNAIGCLISILFPFDLKVRIYSIIGYSHTTEMWRVAVSCLFSGICNRSPFIVMIFFVSLLLQGVLYFSMIVNDCSLYPTFLFRECMGLTCSRRAVNILSVFILDLWRELMRLK